MKTLIQVFLFFFFSISILKAQPTSGTIFVGGDLGLSAGSDKTKNDNTTTKNYSTFDYSFLPQVGYFIDDIIAVGARVGLNGYVTNYEDQYPYDKRTSNNFVFNPFARYYLINQKGGLFAEGNMSLSFGKTKTSNNSTTNEVNSNNIFVGVRPGLYYYFSDRIVLQAYYGWFGYQSSIEKDDNDIKDINNTFGFNLNSSSLAFGFVYEF